MDGFGQAGDDGALSPGARGGALAYEYLDARVEYRYGPVMNAVLFVPMLIIGLVAYLLPWGRPEVARPCAVVIFQRSDGVEIARYRYRFAAEAYDHLADLLGRFQTENVASVGRDLGMDWGQPPVA